MDCRPHRERGAEDVDEFAGVAAYDFGSEEPSGARVGEDFHVAVIGVHEDGFAVVVIRIGGGDVGDFFLAEGAFEVADGGKRGVGENDVEEAGG